MAGPPRHTIFGLAIHPFCPCNMPRNLSFLLQFPANLPSLIPTSTAPAAMGKSVRGFCMRRHGFIVAVVTSNHTNCIRIIPPHWYHISSSHPTSISHSFASLGIAVFYVCRNSDVLVPRRIFVGLVEAFLFRWRIWRKIHLVQRFKIFSLGEPGGFLHFLHSLTQIPSP